MSKLCFFNEIPHKIYFFHLFLGSDWMKLDYQDVSDAMEWKANTLGGPTCAGVIVGLEYIFFRFFNNFYNCLYIRYD